MCIYTYIIPDKEAKKMNVKNFWQKLQRWVEVMENTHDYRAELQRNAVQEIADLRERVKKLEGKDWIFQPI